MSHPAISLDRRTPPTWQLVLAISALLALGACNAVAGTPYAATPASTAGQASAAGRVVPEALRGTWTADVRGTTASSGTWTLLISESNLALGNPIGGDPFTLDPVSISATAMVLPADAGCPDQSVVTPGTYTLAISGDTVRITGSDSCGDRRAVLTTGPWTRRR